ncbi:unnamed protein product [Owenia fusiformis]|uniref:Uncharacterized protein n=1 Tax=Owenia fusiformis TaxID=6347 RepID=A0A8J1XGB8_OWEFU|nr:unnamed protein product [Owenia fusiformis]
MPNKDGAPRIHPEVNNTCNKDYCSSKDVYAKSTKVIEKKNRVSLNQNGAVGGSEPSSLKMDNDSIKGLKITESSSERRDNIPTNASESPTRSIVRKLSNASSNLVRKLSNIDSRNKLAMKHGNLDIKDKILSRKPSNAEHSKIHDVLLRKGTSPSFNISNIITSLTKNRCGPLKGTYSIPADSASIEMRDFTNVQKGNHNSDKNRCSKENITSGSTDTIEDEIPNVNDANNAKDNTSSQAINNLHVENISERNPSSDTTFDDTTTKPANQDDDTSSPSCQSMTTVQGVNTETMHPIARALITTENLPTLRSIHKPTVGPDVENPESWLHTSYVNDSYIN